MKYNFYKKFKKKAYHSKKWTYLFAVRSLPVWVLKIIFPLLRVVGNNRSGEFLDIGSGSGFLAFFLREKLLGKVDQVEPYLDDIYGGNPTKKDFLSANIQKKYDTVFCIDVLEHIGKDDIHKFLKKIRFVTKLGGTLLVKTPNASSIAGLESVFGDPTHVNQFNSHTLTALLEQHGFQVCNLIGIRSNLSLKRMIYLIISSPLTLLLLIYLKGQGCTGVLLSPSVAVRAIRID